TSQSSATRTDPLSDSYDWESVPIEAPSWVTPYVGTRGVTGSLRRQPPCSLASGSTPSGCIESRPPAAPTTPHPPEFSRSWASLLRAAYAITSLPTERGATRSCTHFAHEYPT